MKSVLKFAALLLISSPVLASVSTVELSQMKQEIQTLKEQIKSDCQKELVMTSAPECIRAASELKKSFCGKKMEIITYFEAITSKQNISVVAQRFGDTPPADALGAVLLWQMKNSIDQVNSTWARKVDLMKKKTVRCAPFDLKKEIFSYTSYVKQMLDLDQTTLLVRSEAL